MYLADCRRYAPSLTESFENQRFSSSRKSPVFGRHPTPRKRTRSAVGRDTAQSSVSVHCVPGIYYTAMLNTGCMMAVIHRLGFRPNKNGGRDESCHHYRVGVGHSEGTPVETALPAGVVGLGRASVKKRVGEPGSPTLSERISASSVG